MSEPSLILTEEVLPDPVGEAPRPPARRAGLARWTVTLLLIAVVAGALLWRGSLLGRLAAEPGDGARRSTGPAGRVVPSPNDAAWVDYYRNRQEGVSMAVHLPVDHGSSEVVVWEKFADAGASVVALSEMHYDCSRRTRRSARMAIYRGGLLQGVVPLPAAAAAVPVPSQSVEEDALVLACTGEAPQDVDQDS